MNYKEYSYRHGKELFEVLHPDLYTEVCELLEKTDRFTHGQKKNYTIKHVFNHQFITRGWTPELPVEFNTHKNDFVDFYKSNVAIEMEFSRFEMFFRDFFRFMLLYHNRQIDLGIIITLNDDAFNQWGSTAKSYKSARASIEKLIDFLEGEYSSLINVPLWCIGVE